MRKSGRLASIHDDDTPSTPSTDDNPSANTADTKTKKFAPTIPTIRRKKVVEEEPAATETSSATPSNTSTNQRNNQSRKPLNANRNHTTAPVVVSGPLSMGPAAMARSSRSSGSSGSGGGGGIFSARSVSRLNASSSSASDSKPLSDSVTVEDEFAVEGSAMANELLKPVALLDIKKESDGFTHFEPETGKLFLFQMPPVLPTLLNSNNENNEQTASNDSAEKWPAGAQGRYGKLRRYKSGRITIILENGVEFLVNPSIDNAADAQNTSVLAIDPEFAQSFNLGQIEGKFVCVPEFDKFQTLSIYQ